MEDSCEHGNEPSGSIKRWEILELDRQTSNIKLRRNPLIGRVYDIRTNRCYLQIM
jgi:hypothetical protein